MDLAGLERRKEGDEKKPRWGWPMHAEEGMHATEEGVEFGAVEEKTSELRRREIETHRR